MKKFKIIEEGRILSNEELNQLNGGCERHIGCNDYTNCIEAGYMTCKPNDSFGFNATGNCNGENTFVSCNEGFSFVIDWDGGC